MSIVRLLAAALLALAPTVALAEEAASPDAAAQSPDAAVQDRLARLTIGTLRAVTVHDAPQPTTDATFVNEAGETVSLADFEGDVVVLNLWATWCAPCEREMPYLDDLAARMADRPLTVLTISVEGHDPRVLRAWLDERGLSNLFGWSGAFDFARAINAQGLPTTLVLDHKGREVARLAGEAEWNAAEAVAFVETLLAPAEAAPES